MAGTRKKAAKGGKAARGPAGKKPAKRAAAAKKRPAKPPVARKAAPAATPPPPPPPADAGRRIPAQARSRARLERILDAAAAIFDEVGYEAATTDAIAHRAETSIGSIYQFFPNKDAVFEALAARLRADIRAVFEDLATPEVATLPLEALIDRFLATYVDFLRTRPGARALLRGIPGSAELAAGEAALQREFGDRVALLLAFRGQGLSPARRQLVATVVVHATSALMLVALRDDEPGFGDRVIAEARKIMLAYLGPHLG